MEEVVRYLHEEEGKLHYFLGNNITGLAIKMEIVRYLNALEVLPV